MEEKVLVISVVHCLFIIVQADVTFLCLTVLTCVCVQVRILVGNFVCLVVTACIMYCDIKVFLCELMYKCVCVMFTFLGMKNTCSSIHRTFTEKRIL